MRGDVGCGRSLRFNSPLRENTPKPRVYDEEPLQRRRNASSCGQTPTAQDTGREGDGGANTVITHTGTFLPLLPHCSEQECSEERNGDNSRPHTASALVSAAQRSANPGQQRGGERKGKRKLGSQTNIDIPESDTGKRRE